MRNTTHHIISSDTSNPLAALSAIVLFFDSLLSSLRSEVAEPSNYQAFVVFPTIVKPPQLPQPPTKTNAKTANFFVALSLASHSPKVMA